MSDDDVVERATKRLRLFARSPYRDTEEGEAYLQDVAPLLARVSAPSTQASPPPMLGAAPPPAPPPMLGAEPEAAEPSASEKELKAAKKEVEKLKKQLAAALLRVDAWKGEVKNLLYDRPRALGQSSKEVIAELVAEMEARAEAKAEVEPC